MVRQVSPRLRLLGGRWCWDPGASAGAIWVYVGVLLRMMWVKEKGEFWRCRTVVKYGYWVRQGSVIPVTELGTSVI